MKKILTLTIAAFAMANAVFAQTEKEMAALETKANAAVDKVAAKVKKAEDAAALKAFKEKQKADLAAFIEAQKTGKTAESASELKIEKPVLANEDEETAYLFGIAQSNGLKDYATGQLGVDEEHLSKFAEGILSRTNADPNVPRLANASLVSPSSCPMIIIRPTRGRASILPLWEVASWLA